VDDAPGFERSEVLSPVDQPEGNWRRVKPDSNHEDPPFRDEEGPVGSAFRTWELSLRGSEEETFLKAKAARLWRQAVVGILRTVMSWIDGDVLI
jgi:hypothetical protein